MIQGKPENAFDRYDFARMLDDKLGQDAGDYCRDLIGDLREEILDDVEKDPTKYCLGECDNLFRLQEHYQRAIQDALNLLYDAQTLVLTGSIGSRKNTAQENKKLADKKFDEAIKILEDET